MEKRKATHDLKKFQAAFARAVKDNGSRTPIIAGSAIQGARSLGKTIAAMAEDIAELERKHFRKSVTSHNNSQEWQDVYHLPTDEYTIYIKFRDDVVTEFRLLSFKRRGDD